LQPGLVRNCGVHIRYGTVLVLVALLMAAPGTTGAAGTVAAPPLANSSNVELLANIPGTAAGMSFADHYA